MELKNKFDRAQSELRFESKNYRDGQFVPVGGGNVWKAEAEPRNPQTHEPISVSAGSREALVRKLAEGLPGFKLYRTEADDLGDELRQIKTERAQQLAREKAAAVEAAKPERTMFGLPESDPQAHDLARREIQEWYRRHASEPDFIVSEFNERNLIRRLNEERDRGDWDSPTLERIEAAYQFLSANNFWEKKYRKRGEPAVLPYYAQPVAPQPTQEEIAVKEHIEALAERKKLEAMPLNQLKALAERDRIARVKARQQQSKENN